MNETQIKLVTECVRACQTQRGNLEKLTRLQADAGEGEVIPTTDAIHNAVEGLRLTEQKLTECLDEGFVSVATYSRSGRFHGMKRMTLRAFKAMDVPTIHGDMATIMARIKPEHTEWEFRSDPDNDFVYAYNLYPTESPS